MAAPPAPRRTWAYGIAAAAIAVVLILVALFVAGIGPFAPSGNGSGSNPSFATAARIAERTASSYASGSWTLVYAAGIVFGANFSSAINASAIMSSVPSSECTLVPTTEFPTSISQSASTFNRSSGGAPIWVFLLRSTNATGLVVWVHNGVGQPLVTLSGGICGSALAFLPALPAGIVDSSVAVSAALNGGGYGFLKQHPNANLTMSVHGPISLSLTSSIPGNWSITLETCGLNASTSATSAGAVFTAQVGVTTGKLLAPPVTNSSGCGTGGLLPGGLGGPPPTLTPIGTALSFGSVSTGYIGSGSATGYYDNASVSVVSTGLEWANVSFLVVTPSGGIAGGPVSLLVTGPSGCLVANYSFQFAGFVALPLSDPCAISGALPGATAIQSNQEIHLLSSTSLIAAGDSLEVIGQPPYTGALTTPLP